MRNTVSSVEEGAPILLVEPPVGAFPPGRSGGGEREPPPRAQAGRDYERGAYPPDLDPPGPPGPPAPPIPPEPLEETNFNV